MPAAYLQLGVSQVLPVDGDTGVYQEYLDQLLKESGDITDPIERMLIKATALAFHRSGQLLVKSTKAENLQASALYNMATAKMLAEFRHQALSLEIYRTSASARRRDDADTPAVSKKKAPTLRCVK
jgi:hypothetical protein